MSYCFGKTIYPEGLAAPLLDSICRHTLWQHGLDYRHGTGHGVGFALNVHEGSKCFLITHLFMPIVSCVKV